MARLRLIAVAVGAAGAAAALIHRGRHGVLHRDAPGGILIANPSRYDQMTGWFFRSLFGPIAADIAAAAPDGGRILEVGCGPGHLSIVLAAEHGLDVTALDLDPEMIDRARRKADQATAAGHRAPVFLAADVAQLPFDEASFDLIVSTYSMHHWSDKPAGLAEIRRVLRPGGRALIWDLRKGFALFHMQAPDPMEPIGDAPLDLIGTTDWLWPRGFTFTQRLELARPPDAA
jgi:SAM-dependent methyltransferase